MRALRYILSEGQEMKIETIESLCAYLTAQGYDFTQNRNTISAGGNLYLGSLTALPEGVTISAGGYLYLGSLTALPEGVTISAGRNLYLGSLTDEEQPYQEKRIRLRTVDGYAMRLISKRMMGEAELWSAQYFKGNLETDKRCFVATEGGYSAHGETAEQALRDLRFKIAQVDFDPEELVATIRERGTVTFNDYRLLTGACESGLREGLRARGVDPDTEVLPLDQVLELCRDGYGGERFATAVKSIGDDVLPEGEG
jgi:hypothetical protein